MRRRIHFRKPVCTVPIILSVYLNRADAKGVTGTRALQYSEFPCARTTDFLIRLIRQTQFYWLALITSQLCGHPGVFSVQKFTKGNWLGVVLVQADSSRNGEGAGMQTGSCLGEGRPQGSQCEGFKGGRQQSRKASREQKGKK